MIVVPADIVFEGDITIDIGGCTVMLLQAKAPHTDDSTLIYVCEDKTLFVGDATYPEFSSGVKNRKLADILADKIRLTGAVTCVEGHWQPTETQDTLADLLDFI